MFTLNGSPISIDNEFTTEDGVTYPHLRDPAVREQLGIIEVADDPWYDQRFYWGVDNPKDLDQLKAQWIAQTKQIANATLAQTDWMVIRKAERNIDIPEDVATARAAAIQEANDKEAAITAATTVEELMTALGFVPTEAPAPVVEEVVLAEEPAPAMTSEQISAL
jgi:hypothetical protein